MCERDCKSLVYSQIIALINQKTVTTYFSSAFWFYTSDQLTWWRSKLRIPSGVRKPGTPHCTSGGGNTLIVHQERETPHCASGGGKPLIGHQEEENPSLYLSRGTHPLYLRKGSYIDHTPPPDWSLLVWETELSNGQLNWPRSINGLHISSVNIGSQINDPFW